MKICHNWLAFVIKRSMWQSVKDLFLMVSFFLWLLILKFSEPRVTMPENVGYILSWLHVTVTTVSATLYCSEVAWICAYVVLYLTLKGVCSCEFLCASWWCNDCCYGAVILDCSTSEMLICVEACAGSVSESPKWWFCRGMRQRRPKQAQPWVTGISLTFEWHPAISLSTCTDETLFRPPFLSDGLISFSVISHSWKGPSRWYSSEREKCSKQICPTTLLLDVTSVVKAFSVLTTC